MDQWYELKCAQAPAPSIEQGKVLGLRGVYRTLHFPLPAQVANDASTVLRVEYQVHVQRSLYEWLVFTTLTMVILAVSLAYRSKDCPWLRAVISQFTLLMPIMQLASWVLIVACISTSARSSTAY